MNTIEFRNTTKHMLPILILIMMLLSMFAGINIKPAKAFEFTLVATVTENPYYGYYGGYHSIWAAIKNDLAAIGIDVQINQYSEFNWWKRVWDVGWSDPWHGGGWDFTILEWWLQPHALDPWFTSMVRADLTPDSETEGYNIHPWNNTDADGLLINGSKTFNAPLRKLYMDKWQKEFMKDPPWINLYYPKVYEVMASYLTGYEPSGCWFYETAYLNLNNTGLATYRPDRDPGTLIYAVSEPLWALSPLFMDTYTDEMQSTLQWRTLYKWSAVPFPLDGGVPSREDWAIVPDMAAGPPEFLEGGKKVRVSIRDDMVWQYNDMTTTVPITADDVVWTFNVTLDPDVTSTGIGDFNWIIDTVTRVNDTAVEFTLLYPTPDILSVLANDWGTGSILPKHFLEGINRPGLRTDGSNKGFGDPGAWMPVNGPFMLDPDNPPESEKVMTLIKNPSYYGYNASIVGTPWGPYNVDKMILQWIKDPPSRLTALINNDVDFGEYPTAPVDTFKDLMTGHPNLRVTQYDYPASNPIWLNFNNEYLSNKYIRLAIANAIDYNYIINTLLPPWGIETAERGKTYIMPGHWYTDENATTVQLYDTTLAPFTQNVTKALEYMDRWKKSQVGYGTPYPLGTYLEGAAGDADFSGKVTSADYFIYRDIGLLAGTMAKLQSDYLIPGRDYDPDFDNDGYIDVSPDYPIYRDEVPGAIYFTTPYD
jgi:ABC-type transport system substrate-binding protein